METVLYRYQFTDEVDLGDVQDSLLLAIVGSEALHGESQTRLDAGYRLDTRHRACVVDASTGVGRDLNRLFVTFLRQDLNEEHFTVRRIDGTKVAGSPTGVSA